MRHILNGAILVTLLAAITQNAHAILAVPAPDAGSTSLLLVLACAGLTAVRRFKR
jgi:hypothetical protein